MRVPHLISSCEVNRYDKSLTNPTDYYDINYDINIIVTFTIVTSTITLIITTIIIATITIILITSIIVVAITIGQTV